MRIVVVGGGVIGLLTAIECVRAGARVDLVDQSGIPAAGAASNDTHRVVRALHRGDPRLTLAAAQADRAWLDLQRQIGAWFYRRVGVLTAMPAGEVSGNLGLLTAAGVPAWLLPEERLAARYPQIRFGPGSHALVEPAAGAILAGDALRALAGWLRRQPAAALHLGCPVTAIGEPAIAGPGRRAAAWLADGTVLAGDRVVVAAGAWSRDLLPAGLAAQLTLYRQTVLCYEPCRRTWSGTPVVLGLGPARDAWLMPPVAGTPARLSAASACRAVPEVAGRATPPRWRDHLTGLFGDLLPGFDPARVAGATEGYYLAADASGGPLLASLGDGTIWAYAACGGLSFKFAPLIARAIAGRALGSPARPCGLAPVDQPRELAISPATGGTS